MTMISLMRLLKVVVDRTVKQSASMTIEKYSKHSNLLYNGIIMKKNGAIQLLLIIKQISSLPAANRTWKCFSQWSCCGSGVT